jgi:hypothetical protein
LPHCNTEKRSTGRRKQWAMTDLHDTNILAAGRKILLVAIKQEIVSASRGWEER